MGMALTVELKETSISRSASMAQRINRETIDGKGMSEHTIELKPWDVEKTQKMIDLPNQTPSLDTKYSRFRIM